MADYKSPSLEEVRRQENLFRAQHRDRLAGGQINNEDNLEKEYEGLDDTTRTQEFENLRLRDKIKRGLARVRKAQEKEAGPLDRAREVEEKVKRIRNLYRLINGASAVSLVGLLITFLVMNTQFWLGNVLGKKFIPKLEWWECLVLALINLFLMLVLIAIFAIAYILLHPCEFMNWIGLSWLKGLCDLFMPEVGI